MRQKYPTTYFLLLTTYFKMGFSASFVVVVRVKPGTDKSVPTIFVISFVGTVLTVPAQKPLK